MNPNMQLWVDDLLTTDATQVQFRLTDGTGFCCLGRLCEVAIQNGVPVEKSGVLYDLNGAGLPKRVREWADVSGDLEDRCMAFNDEDRLTFQQIAAEIEKNHA